MIAEHRYALVNKGNQCVVMWSNDLGFLLTLSEEIVKQGGFDLRIVEVIGYDGNGGISDEYPAVLSDDLTGDDLSTVDDGKRECILCEHLYNGYWCLVKNGPRHLIHVCDSYRRARDKNWSWGIDLHD